MTTANHLEWLLYLMADNLKAWRPHCRSRALEVAKDPLHADLPRLLEEAMKSRSSSAVPSAGVAESLGASSLPADTE